MPTLRIAFVQGRPEFGRTEENLEKGLALAATVEADLVVLPELWASGYVFSTHAEVAALAEDACTGATARAIAWAAKREKRHYVVGFAEVARGRHYNSAMLAGPGGVKAVYRKLRDEGRALLLITDIRIRAESKRIIAVETESSRLKCLRGSGMRDDFVMVGARFPRLTAPKALARMKEIIAFLNNLPEP